MIFIEKFNPEHFRTLSSSSMPCIYRDKTIAELTRFTSFISSLNEVFPDYHSLLKSLKNSFFCIDDNVSSPMVKMFHTREEAAAEARKRLNDKLSSLTAQMGLILKQLKDLDMQEKEQE